MEIILLKDVDNVGYRNDVATVKDGYGRNFLIPQGFAMIANKANLAKLDEIKAKEAAAEEARRDEYQAMADKLKDQVIKIGAKAGTSGKIFGSVTNVQIAAALKDQFGIEIERKKIELEKDVKELGTYNGQLNLHKEIEAPFTFEVVAE